MKEENLIPFIVFFLLFINEEETRQVLELTKNMRKTRELKLELDRIKRADEKLKKQCFELLIFHSVTSWN